MGKGFTKDKKFRPTDNVWIPKISSKGMNLSANEIIARANDEAVASGVDLEVLEPYRKVR